VFSFWQSPDTLFTSRITKSWQSAKFNHRIEEITMRATRIAPSTPASAFRRTQDHRPQVHRDHPDHPFIEVLPSTLNARNDVERASDLRRRHARRLIEHIVAAAAVLPDQERLLIETTYGDGKRLTDIARLRGDDPRTLRRRVRGIVRRMLDPEFGFVASRRAEWPRTRRLVAERCVLQGVSLRDAATTLGISLHTVRRHRDAIRALADAATTAPRRSITELHPAASRTPGR
jgi:DNA-directed RNA polymerase specialized sigma24 family protein